MILRRTLAPLAVLTLVAVGGAARADLPPPDGTKFVGYGFKITGLAVAPDRVLFAQPCSGSDGAPTADAVKIDDGRIVSVGRRGGTCAVYNIAKTRWEEFAKDYKPTMSSDDPAARAIAAEAKKCEGGPTPMHQTSKDDARTGLTEALRVVKLDGATCVLKSDGIEGGPPGGGGGGSGTSSNPKKSGCAAAAGAIDGASSWAALVALGATVFRRRRRR